MSENNNSKEEIIEDDINENDIIGGKRPEEKWVNIGDDVKNYQEKKSKNKALENKVLNAVKTGHVKDEENKFAVNLWNFFEEMYRVRKNRFFSWLPSSFKKAYELVDESAQADEKIRAILNSDHNEDSSITILGKTPKERIKTVQDKIQIQKPKVTIKQKPKAKVKTDELTLYDCEQIRNCLYTGLLTKFNGIKIEDLSPKDIKKIEPMEEFNESEPDNGKDDDDDDITNLMRQNKLVRGVNEVVTKFNDKFYGRKKQEMIREIENMIEQNNEKKSTTKEKTISEKGEKLIKKIKDTIKDEHKTETKKKIEKLKKCYLELKNCSDPLELTKKTTELYEILEK